MSSVNRILVDSRLRQPDSKSNSDSDFRIEPPENLDMDEGVSCGVCDISLLVTWYSLEPDLNDKLYIKMYQANGTAYRDHIFLLPIRNCTRLEVAAMLTNLFAD